MRDLMDIPLPPLFILMPKEEELDDFIGPYLDEEYYERAAEEYFEMCRSL